MSRSRTAKAGQAGPVLRTGRLLLRQARDGDLEDLFAIYGDPRAMRYWSRPPDESPADTAALLDRMMAVSPDAVIYFVLERDGRVIGTAGMHGTDEIGFILHPDHWRQGLVREAMQAIIPYLFATTSVARLTADADPRNAASVGLLQALGFHRTGTAKNTYCVAGEWSDSVYFALDRPAPDGSGASG